MISVIDKGIGFDKHQIDELFKKFTKMSRLGTAKEFMHVLSSHYVERLGMALIINGNCICDIIIILML